MQSKSNFISHCKRLCLIRRDVKHPFVTADIVLLFLITTLARTLLVVSSQHAMIKYVSRGEFYSTWKFHQRDSDRHRGDLTEDAKRIGFVDSEVRLPSLTISDVHRKKVKTSFLLPSRHEQNCVCIAMSPRIWKVYKVNLRARKKRRQLHFEF